MRSSFKSLGFLACLTWSGLVLSGPLQDSAAKKEEEPVSYFKQIRPILQRQCQGCHQPASKQADLMLTSYETFKGGGRGGPAFVPGQPDQSLLLAYLKGAKQP